MIPNCVTYAAQAKEAGRPVVGIMCEVTPREVILAAGGVPVCLCGGSAESAAAAEDTLPANLCPLIKSTYGYHVTESNPFLEMADLLVAETTCDGKKKMYEILAEERPMHVLEYPQKPDDADAFEYWVKALAKLRADLESRFDVKITDDALRAAIRDMNRERSLRRRLAGLMAADAPPITGRQLLDMKSVISCVAADFEQYEAAIEKFEGAEGDPAMGNRVRVLLTGVPTVAGAERVVDIIEDNGGLVVAMESCTGWKPIATDIPDDGEDPLRDIARKYIEMPCSVQTPNSRRFDLLRELAAEYRAECVIDLIWQACLTYDVESVKVKRLADEELHLPFLRIETDYTPSDTARITVRVEALFETARARAPGRV